jgi:protein-serine/threonine kinase
MFKSSYCVTRRELGSGAYGRVQMAYQVATGQQIACKVVDIKLAKAKYEMELQKQLGQAKFGPFVQRMVLSRRRSIEDKLSKFYREAHTLKLLSHVSDVVWSHHRSS